MKFCKKCGENKTLDLFKKDKRNKNSRAETCKACHVISCREYQVGSIKFAAYQKTYRSLEKEKQRKSQWKKDNPEKHAAQENKRRIQRNRATPCWLTKTQLTEMEDLRTLAKELSWLSEDPLVVDHIMPILGKNSCGLHVPWNLQILPKRVNCSKGNRVEGWVNL